ncbi:ABC transporter permease [Limobrevibacterium gyesilva]|uniref:ABC transporter permease n=1 Tax=Limobrevibacterium gyesilva TaxID=2991712 RepID=A0AA41YK33_9PROT|nr:ABC transporter permease [Limobrevibacterium gyesilva]MCW3473293.1 ABC transporter permease [Limobrevibacterium gyesilva]
MRQLEFVVARLLKVVLVMFGIVVLNFFLVRLAPGDPATVLAGEAGAVDPQFMSEVRARYGLDRPIHEQLAIYVRRVATLDFGESYRIQRPAMDLIAERLPATLLLSLSAFVFAMAAGVALGVLAARRVGRWQDMAISVTALVFFAMPLFWVGLMAILLFSVQLGWLPAYGLETVGGGFSGLRRAFDIAAHLVLPATTLGLFYVAIYVRMTRASVLEVSRLDFVRTARAKGIREPRIWRRHILKNALLPVITLASLQAGSLVGGAVVTETVFAWPGVGRLAFEALGQRDYNLLLAIFAVTSAVVLLFNLVADIVYSLVDPRIEARA